MKRSLKFFNTAILCLGFVFTQAQIVISEISYNPPESGTDSLEYFEIFNNGPSTVDLTGWTVGLGVVHTFEGTIESGSYKVICKSSSAIKAIFGIEAQEWTDGSLNNNGEPLTILNNSGETVDSVNFDDVNGWPNEASGTDGAGASIDLCDVNADNNLAASWKSSKKSAGKLVNGFVVYGTPGGPSQCETIASATVSATFEKKFTPQEVIIFVGETVIWKNTGGSHNLNGTIDKYPNNPESFGRLDISDSLWTYSHTFTKPGLYNYVCDPHEADNMKGTVLVQEIDLSSASRDLRIVNEIIGYPNPTNGLFQLSTSKTIDLILVYNSNGILLKREIPTSNTSIDLTDLPSGLYLVNALTSQGINVIKCFKE